MSSIDCVSMGLLRSPLRRTTWDQIKLLADDYLPQTCMIHPGLLRRVSLARTEPRKTLRDQALFGHQAHERDG
jgi:hypothetical protein